MSPLTILMFRSNWGNQPCLAQRINGKTVRLKPYVPKGVFDPTFQARITKTIKNEILTTEIAALLKLRTGDLTEDELLGIHHIFNTCTFFLGRHRQFDEELDARLANGYCDQLFEANSAIIRAYKAKVEGKARDFVFRGEEIELVLNSIEASCKLMKDEIERFPRGLVYDYVAGALLHGKYGAKILTGQKREVTNDIFNSIYKTAIRVLGLPDQQRQQFLLRECNYTF